ncbi:MAG: tetratricopeptide repeat protein, partial [Bacteroidota bacterium]|nr:tetratricopeptide repeat protein [Bacteroidota bacterium]
MEEYKEFFEDPANDLVKRLENKLHTGESFYFDVEDYELILDHYLQEDDLEKCFLVLQNAMEQHPNTISLTLRQVQFLISKNNTEKALRILKEVEAIDPYNKDIFRTRGDIYSQLQFYHEAIKEYQKAIDDTEENLDEIYSNIAFEYENLHNYDKALEYLKKAIDFNPENDSALFELSFCAEMAEKPKVVVDYLLKYLDNHPYSKAGWFNLGLAYSSLLEHEKAIDAYDFVLAIDDKFSTAYFNKGNALVALGRNDEALKCYHETLLFEPVEGITYYYIGECYEKMDQPEKAEEYYRLAIETDPTVSDARVGLGCVLSERGRHPEAIALFKEALDQAPDNNETWYLLADEYMETGKIKLAEECYAKSLSFDVTNPDVWLDYSNALAEEYN